MSGQVIVIGGGTSGAATLSADNTFTGSNAFTRPLNLQAVGGDYQMGIQSVSLDQNQTLTTIAGNEQCLVQLLAFDAGVAPYVQLVSVASGTQTGDYAQTVAVGAGQFTDAATKDTTVAAGYSGTLRLGVGDFGVNASTAQMTATGTNFNGTISSGGTAGLNQTIVLAKLTTANGSATFKNGILTAYTAPT